MKFAARVFLFSLFLAGSGYLFVSKNVLQVSAQTSSCLPRYDSSVQTPPGYGASFNVFSSARELLLNVSCPSSDAQFVAGTNDANYQQYVYKNAYRWDGTHWIPITLSGTAVTGTNGDWLKAPASITIAKSVFRPSGFYNYIASYSCTFVGGAWKCGCRESLCPISLWQLQSFRSPIVLTPTGGTGCAGGTAPTWVAFNTASIPVSKTTAELGITEPDLRSVIKARTGQSELVAMEQARQILAANANLASFGLTAPITVSWSGSTLVVSYKGKPIETFAKPTASSLEPEWGPVSFDQLALADRPTAPGAEYYIEALMQYNFRYSGASVGFEVRGALIGATGGGSCGLTGGGGTGGDPGPLPREFPPINECGTPTNVTPSTLNSNLGNGCKTLILSPGAYGMLKIQNHTGGVLTLRCASRGACTFQGGGTSNNNVIESDGVILDGLSWTAGYLTFSNSRNVRLQNSIFRNLTSTGVLVMPDDRSKQYNIQFVGNDVYNDPSRIESTLGDGSKNYTMDYGFRIYYANSIYIANNTFGGGFNHAISTKEYVGYALVENNQFNACGRSCVEVGQEPLTTDCPDNKTSEEMVIQGNHFAGQGLVGVLIKNQQKTTIINNSFQGFTGRNIKIDSFSPGEVVSSCHVAGTGVPSNREIIQSGNN